MRYLTIILAALLLSTTARADIFDTYGYGTRGMAMGGASCASALDSSALYYNPGALSRIDSHTTELSYMYSSPSIDKSGPVYGIPKESRLEVGTCIIGLSLDVNEIADFERNCTFSFGLSVRDDLKFLSLEDLEERKYSFIQFNSSINRSAIYMGLGIEAIEDFLRIGFGAHSIVNGEAATNLTLAADELSTTQQVIPSDQEIWMEMELTASPIAGIILSPVNNLDIGLTYRDGINVEIDPFHANLNITIGSHAAIINAYTAILAFWTPESYQAGVAYTHEDLVIELDATYRNWSEFERSVPRELRRVAPKFDDVVSYHLGLEYSLDDFSLMAGYQYSPSPLPDQPLDTNYLDNDRHIISGGARGEIDLPFLRNPAVIGIALQYQLLDKKRFRKINSASYSIEGDVLTAALSLEIRM